jgi:hypothetical protein
MTTLRTLLGMAAAALLSLPVTAQADSVTNAAAAKYDRASMRTGNIVIAQRGDKYGVVSKNGELLLPFVYDGTEPQFNHGYLKVYKGGNEGIINDEGKLIVEPIYQYVSTANKDFFVIKLNGKYGTIDHEGKQVIPTDYARELVFTDGMASVELNGKYGFINPRGELIIPYQYDSPSMFNNGRAMVTLQGETFAIDKQNRRIEEQADRNTASKPAKNPSKSSRKTRRNNSSN